MSEKSLFDILKDLSYTKAPYDPNVKYSKFMVNRFISMCEAYIPLVNEVNRGNILDIAHYNYFKILLPKRNQFFKYIGKAKQYTDEIEILEYIETNLKVSRRDASRYYKHLTEEMKNEIRETFETHFKKTKISATSAKRKPKD